MRFRVPDIGVLDEVSLLPHGLGRFRVDFSQKPMGMTDTETGGPGMAFPSTVWSRVTKADPGGPRPGDVDLEKLIGRYWKPVYHYLHRSWSKKPEDAKDLTQQFFMEEVLEHGLLDRYQPERGSFRAFLKGALGNFMGHAAERAGARKRGGHLKVLSLEGIEGDVADFLPDPRACSPDRIFDESWKRIVLETAAQSVERQCRQEGKEIVFDVFRRYDLEPETPDVSYRSLGEALKLSADTIKNHLTRARDLYLAAVTEVVRETVRGPEELSRELQDLFGM